jgi:hypothetical protein
MSMTLTLIPATIALSATLSSSAVGLLTSLDLKDGCPDLPAVETCFADPELLLQTLTEHGFTVDKISENEYVVQTEAGRLRYFRRSAEEAFQVEATQIKDPEGLLHSLDLLENEYGRNVQKYTYETVRCNLARHGMRLENEEVLEDDTLLLTLTLD